MIRAIPSNASDSVYCTLLAQSAVHGAMAGYTGFTVGPVNGRHSYLPFYVSLPLLKLYLIIFSHFDILHSLTFLLHDTLIYCIAIIKFSLLHNI